MATAREIGITLPKEIHCHKTKATGRRTKYQRSTLVSFVTALIRSLSAQSVVSLLLLREARRGREDHLNDPPKCNSNKGRGAKWWLLVYGNQSWR